MFGLPLSDVATYAVYGVAVLVVVCFAYRFLRSAEDPVITIYYRQKGTYCDVWSPQLPGAARSGSTVGPALVKYLTMHGNKLGIRLKEDPSWSSS